MRLYKVEYFTYDQANSLLPPRDPEPDEVTQVEAAITTQGGREIVALLIRLGYTPFQAEHMYRALFNHYWYDFRIREVFRCHQMIKYWIGSYVAPAWVQARELPPPTFPAAVIFTVVVVGMIVVAALIVAPDWNEKYRWYPPCDLYLGTYDESLSWMCLAGVSAQQRPYYEALGHEGAVITAHSYEYKVPPVVDDVLHFWGTMEFRCWQVPWFRVYRAQSANCTFVGLLEHVSAHVYRLREPFVDRFAPSGPMSVPPDEYCTVFSPCG